MVWRDFPGTNKVEGTLRDVLQQARNFIHQGHRLINHPLAGSVKPNETPYKSLVLSSSKVSLDYNSLCLIESAIEVTDKLPLLERNWEEKVDQDFQFIDLTLLRTAIEQLPLDMHV
jgi:hypothetical protein